MTTKLYLRNTQLQVTGYYDLSVIAGSSLDTTTTLTVAYETEVPVTKTSGGTEVKFISRPIGIDLTLTTASVSLWEAESSLSANCGGRVRLFRYVGATGAEEELGSGPFDFGSEMYKSGTPSWVPRNDTWAANFADTAFVRGDRIVLKPYVTNIGTMGGGYICVTHFNTASDSGSSYLDINEDITFLDAIATVTY